MCVCVYVCVCVCVIGCVGGEMVNELSKISDVIRQAIEKKDMSLASSSCDMGPLTFGYISINKIGRQNTYFPI